MAGPSEYIRSSELMSRADTALVVVDVQEKLIRLLPNYERIVWNIGRLLDGAKLLGMPILGTEQYPKGLGATIVELSERTGLMHSKVCFSCCGCEEFIGRIGEHAVTKVLLTGIEAHVCVQQTALDLLAAGYRVFLAVDAIGSRFDIDYQTAVRRMDSAGVTLTTTESALFEWCEVAGTSEFKQISALVRQAPPEIQNK